MRTWCAEEIRILVENYNSVSNEMLQKMIPNKSKLGIYKKAYAIGLRKNRDIELLNRSLSHKGQNAANWKGGKRNTCKGYTQVHMPGHPRADSGGYVMEHIVVFERETGVSVPLSCCIHHINGDKKDNRIENLCMMTNGAHSTFHNRKRGKRK